MALVAGLAVSAVYLYGMPQANVLYAGVVLAHALGGLAAALLLVPLFLRLWREANWIGRVGWLLFLGGAAAGLVLFKTGALKAENRLLATHMIVSAAAVGFLVAGRWSGRRVGSETDGRRPQSSPKNELEWGTLGLDGLVAVFVGIRANHGRSGR